MEAATAHSKGRKGGVFILAATNPPNKADEPPIRIFAQLQIDSQCLHARYFSLLSGRCWRDPVALGTVWGGSSAIALSSRLAGANDGMLTAKQESSPCPEARKAKSGRLM